MLSRRLPGFLETTRLAVDDAEFVVRHRMVRVEFERLEQMLFSCLEIACLVFCNTKINARPGAPGSCLGHLGSIVRSHRA